MRGDRRPLYLGWLLAAQQSYNEDEENLFEPPVPPGLKSLSASEQALANFLGIDPNLIVAAAERSADLGKSADSVEDRAQTDWVQALPAEKKDAYLLQLLRGEGVYLGAELHRRFRDDRMRTRQKDQSTAEKLARRAGALGAFTARLAALREKHATKRTFLERLDKKQLPQRGISGYLSATSDCSSRSFGVSLQRRRRGGSLVAPHSLFLFLISFPHFYYEDHDQLVLHSLHGLQPCSHLL